MLTIRWWNTTQVFTQSLSVHEAAVWPQPGPLDGKALLWDTEGTEATLTLTSAEPSMLVGWNLLPRQRIAPLPTTTRRGRWEGSPGGRAVLDAAREAGAVRLAPAVWTRQANGILMDLRRLGIDAVPEITCPHGRVFHWNTRVGMRELFHAIPALAPFLPPSMVCHDVFQVRAAIDRLGHRPMLVKSNFSLGGAGTWLPGPGEPFNPEVPDASSGNNTAKAIPWAWREEPFVVESLMGDIASNLSVTLDARNHADGQTDIVGYAEQILANRFSYAGIRSLDPARAANLETSFHSIAGAIGEALAARGFNGFFNVDFVVTAADQIFVADLNLRRSAPLDVQMLLRRLGGGPFFDYHEAKIINATSAADVERCLASAGLAWDGQRGALVLGAVRSMGDERRAPILTVAASAAERITLEQRINHVLL